MYADDVVLLAPTREALQTLVNECERQAISSTYMQFNPAKSVYMEFLPRKPYSAAHLGWVKLFKYLGHVLRDDLQDIDEMRRVKRALYNNANVLSAVVGFADKGLLTKLFKTYCTNIYGCELWDVYRDQKTLHELCVAYRNCIKKTRQSSQM